MSKVGEAKNLIVQTSDGNIVRVGCCRSSKSPVKNNVTQKLIVLMASVTVKAPAVKVELKITDEGELTVILPIGKVAPTAP